MGKEIIKLFIYRYKIYDKQLSWRLLKISAIVIDRFLSIFYIVNLKVHIAMWNLFTKLFITKSLLKIEFSDWNPIHRKIISLYFFQAAQLIKWTLQLLMNYQNFWLNIKEINMETWMSKSLLAKKKNRQRTPVLRPQTLAQSDKSLLIIKALLIYQCLQ